MAPLQKRPSRRVFFPVRYVRYTGEEQLLHNDENNHLWEENEADKARLEEFARYVASKGGKLELTSVAGFGCLKDRHPAYARGNVRFSPVFHPNMQLNYPLFFSAKCTTTNVVSYEYLCIVIAVASSGIHFECDPLSVCQLDVHVPTGGGHDTATPIYHLRCFP